MDRFVDLSNPQEWVALGLALLTIVAIGAVYGIFRLVRAIRGGLTIGQVAQNIMKK
jgi:hypothetical protein